MANVILKSVKFSKILSGRLSRIQKLSYINGQHIVRSYKQTKYLKGYATAAYKLAVNEDSVVKNSAATSNTIRKDIHSVDDGLSKIDSVIKRNGRTQMKNVYEVFSSITSTEMTTSTHGLYLIRCCKYCCDEPPSKRIELVNQIWNKYQELGIKFDVRHYNSLLDVHIRNGFNFDPAEILASMEDVNIGPNKVTYMLLMKKYCRDGNINGASEVLKYMKEEGLSADETVFNYLIEGHIRNNDFTGAKDMIEVMRSSNLQPNADTYTTLACGYAARGEKNEVMSCLKECKEENTIENYLTVIDALATSGNHQYIDDVLSLIQHKEMYQQEFINAAVELIHKDIIYPAYKLIVASCTRGYYEGTNIFIKQLIKVGKPPSEVIQFCERILDEGLHQGIFITISRFVAENGKLDYAIPLFKKMMERGCYVRCNNFWPLLTSLKEEKSFEDVWLILNKMNELGIPCDFTTYHDVLYPMLGTPHPKDVLHNVKRSGQSLKIAADALFTYYCNSGEIDYADHLTQIFSVNIHNKLDVEDFVNRFGNLNRETFNKYLKLLKHIFMETGIKNSEIQGRLLAELILQKIGVLESFLNKYEDLTFSQQALNVCEQEVIRRNVSKQIFVKKIRNLSLENASIFKKENISVEDEDKYISHLQAQNISCRPFLTKRILYHIKTRNVSRVVELLTVFDGMKLEYSPTMLTNLLAMYSAVGDIEKAKDAVNKLSAAFPSFKLDISRCIDYVTLLMRYEKYDESFEALKNFLKEPYHYSNKDIAVKNFRRFNMCLSDSLNVQFVKKMQNLLLPLSEELGSKKIFLEPVIDVHLKRNDIAPAFEEFNNIIRIHHIPASLNGLLKKCIIVGEKDILQKVIDLTVKYCGKSFALLELAMAFIETFNTQKAVKVIENLGEETDPKVLEDVCKRLCDQNKLAELEQLILITRSLKHVNREKLYDYALKTYANRNDFEKAIEIFNKLKEEVIDPDSETTKFLQDLLAKNNQPLPLNLMSKDSQATDASKIFLEHLATGNAEAAIKELNGLKKGYIRMLSLKTLTNLIDLCLQKNYTGELSQNVYAMSYIIDNVRDVLKPILEKYSAAGDVEKFISIINFLPDFSLMNVGFNNYFGKACISSGQHEYLLSQLEQCVDKKNKFFSVVAFEELLKYPEFENRIYDLAVKYLHSSYNTPMSIVWACYFSKENFEKADEIIKKFPLQVEKADNVILRKIKENENVTLAQKYIDLLKSVNVRPRVKERAYGAAVDLLVLKGMYDEAAALVVESEKQNLYLHKYYLSTLVTLKNVLENENKPVPFTVPLDTSQEQSSDSE